MTARIDLVKPEPSSESANDMSAAGWVRRAPAALAIVGFALAVLRHPLAEALARVLPGRGQISSLGTKIEPFAQVAPTIVGRTGLVLLAVAGVASVTGRGLATRLSLPPRAGMWPLVVVIALTGVWYGWLAEPHNAYYTNARFHWVNYLTWDSDTYLYAAGRIPHLIFYESPYQWQAINAGLLAFLFYALGRKLNYSKGISTAFATVPAIGGNLLLFADTAEDVLLNMTLLLLVILTSLHRRPLFVGLALGAVTFGRPSFMILIACFVVGEVILSVRRGTGVRGADWKYIGTGAGVSIGVIVAGQLVFEILGDRYLFVNGQFVRQEILDQWVPRAVEGFTVSRFSGVYFFHLLWVAPLVLLIGAALAVITASAQTRRVESAIYMSALFVVGHVLTHEFKPLAYYNGRYLAYAFPFLFFMACTLLGHGRLKRSPGIRLPLVALLVLGTSVFPADPVGARRVVAERPETALLSARDELRDITDDRFVFLDFGDALSRNYLTYVLKRDIASVHLLADTKDELVRPVPPGRAENLGPDDVVISLRDDPWTNDPPELEVGDFVVFVVRGPER